MDVSRFVTYNENDLQDLLKKKTSKNTDSSTKTALTVFQKFCEETGNSFIEGNVTREELDCLLMKFYAGARTIKGELYKVNSMKGIRFGLQRYFAELNGMNIIEDREFEKSNCCYENMLKEIKKSGKGSTEHYAEIEPEDLKKLYKSFDINTPIGLLEKVWFDVCFQLIRRGRENLRVMTRETFAVDQDATGKRFVYQPTSEIDKNHSVNDQPFDTIGEGRIYETGGPKCPVETFLRYISHLHPLESALWQRPKPSVQGDEMIWYCCSPLGEKSIGKLLPNMSLKYGLSQRYTNHSIRVTSLQVLDDEHIEGRHIIRVSGHKSVDSVKNYARRLSSSRKRGISSVLASHLSDETLQDEQEVPGKKIQQEADIDFKIGGEFDISVLQNPMEGDNIDDQSLMSLPENLLSGNSTPFSEFFKPTFSMCDGCSFTFNININK